MVFRRRRGRNRRSAALSVAVVATFRAAAACRPARVHVSPVELDAIGNQLLRRDVVVDITRFEAPIIHSERVLVGAFWSRTVEPRIRRHLVLCGSQRTPLPSGVMSGICRLAVKSCKKRWRLKRSSCGAQATSRVRWMILSKFFLTGTKSHLGGRRGEHAAALRRKRAAARKPIPPGKCGEHSLSYQWSSRLWE